MNVAVHHQKVKFQPMEPEPQEKDFDAEKTQFTAEWIRARLDQMGADWLAGKFPEDRESILGRLGYSSYESYLLSPLWQRTRRRVLKRDNRTCVRCSEKATEVHHLAYTELVLKGEDDAHLVSVCSGCHGRIEFDEDRNRRTDAEKLRILGDREGARQERIAAEQSRLHRQQIGDRVRAAAEGRCFRCKGDTEYQRWASDGRVCSIPMSQGEFADVWLCSGCRFGLDHDKRGQPRTDEEKLKLLQKKVNVRYTRPDPSAGFHFRETFWRLNAMQREGIMNEFLWNIRQRDLEAVDPEQFAQLRARYESTKANGRERRKRTFVTVV